MTLVKHSKRTLRSPKCGCPAEAELYYAHDTEKPFSGTCRECGVNGSFVLVNKDMSRHEHSGYEPDEAPVPSNELSAEHYQAAKDLHDEYTNEREIPVSDTQTAPDSKLAALEALSSLLSPSIDKAEIERIARGIIEGIVFPTRTVVVKDDVRREIEGDTHSQLGDVTTAILAGEHVMMVGPAGTGKSTIAEQAAEALGLASYSISLSPQTPASQIVGYMQAAGEYVRTLFREAYENGGVFHFDEVDNAHPSVLAVVNAALANGHMAFPDGMVKRHDDFRAIASANTYGRGATRQYVGRQAIDAATLDRFTVLTIEIDEALETSLVRSTGLESGQVDRVLNYVRKLRTNAEQSGINAVLSPRATVGMARLLTAGMSWEAAVQARVRRGLDDATWSKLSK